MARKRVLRVTGVLLPTTSGTLVPEDLASDEPGSLPSVEIFMTVKETINNAQKTSLPGYVSTETHRREDRNFRHIL